MQSFIKPKKRLIPLNDNDIMLILLRNKETIDKTEQYRQYIQQEQHTSLSIAQHKNLQQPVKPVINVTALGIPDVMLKELTESELIKHHIEKYFQLHSKVGILCISQKDRIQSFLEEYYEYLLDSSIVCDICDCKFSVKEGRRQLDQVQCTVDSCYKQIGVLRTSYKNLKQGITDKGLKILDKLQRVHKIKKILAIVGVWKGGLLSKVGFLAQGENLLQIGILKVLETIQQARDQFRQNSKQYLSYGCFDNIERFLQGKTKVVISKLSEMFDCAILDFVQSKYGLILINYINMVNQLHQYKQQSNQKSSAQQNFKNRGEEVGQNRYLLNLVTINKLNNLNLLLQNNLSKLIQRTLDSLNVKSFDQLEGESDEAYLLFFKKLFQNIQIYFKNWHMATRWHLQYKNQNDKNLQKNILEMGEKYLKFRKTIWIKIQQKIANVIRISYKFYLLQLDDRGKFLLRIYDFIRIGNFFSNGQSRLICKILRQKIRQQNEIFLKKVTNLIKFALTKLLKVNIFDQLLDNFQIKDTKAFLLPIQDIQKLAEILANDVKKSDYNSKVQSKISNNPQTYIQFQNIPQFSPNSVCSYLLKGLINLSKRSIYQPKMSYQLFLKFRQLLELLIYWMFRIFVTQASKKQLFQDWTSFYNIRTIDYKDIQLNTNLLQYFQDVLVKQKKYPKLRKEIVRIFSKFDSIRVYTNQRKKQDYFNLERLVGLNQNLITLLIWLNKNLVKQNGLFPCQQRQRIREDMDQLGGIIQQLVDLGYYSYFQQSKTKYHYLIPTICDLKWQIKKYNNQTAPLYKEYKTKLIQVFKTQVQALRILGLHTQITKKLQKNLVDIFFQVLIDIFSRIQKVNQNGRQLMRLQVIQLARMVQFYQISADIPTKADLQKYLEIWFEKDQQVIQKLIYQKYERYRIRIWKTFIFTGLAWNSSRQKRQFHLKVIQKYHEYIGNRRM